MEYDNKLHQPSTYKDIPLNQLKIVRQYNQYCRITAEMILSLTDDDAGMAHAIRYLRHCDAVDDAIEEAMRLAA